MKHIWSALCTHAIVDSFTNQVSLIDILEEITIFDEPKPKGVVPLNIDLMTFWVRDNLKIPEKGYYRVRFLDPSGSFLKSFDELEVNLTNHERSRNKISFQGFSAEEEGVYEFFIDKQDGDVWQEVSQIPVKIIFSPEKSLKKTEDVAE